MPGPPSGLHDDVMEFLCDRRFHRQFTLPADPASGREKPYRISYADYGDPSSTSVVLFFGGLMGGRLAYSPLDQLARKHRVRIIHPDRPGVGGSDAVAIEDRIPTYMSTIPHLLSHLHISTVSLASHSFGAIYLLNTLLMYPHLLHPERPYVAFFAPWVHPSHTKIAHLQAAELLPAGMIGKFASLAKFVNGSLMPLTGISSTVCSTLKTSLSTLPAAAEPVPLAPTTNLSRAAEGDCSDAHALNLDDPNVVQELRKLIPTFLFAEHLDGVSQDAQLCLRKPRSIPWSTPTRPWDDIDAAASLFSTIIGADKQERRASRTWSVDAFHAEADGMVGQKGRAWFDACWVDGAGDRAESRAYVYTSQTVKDADHDFILDPAFGASETWLQRVGHACGRSAGAVVP